MPLYFLHITEGDEFIPDLEGMERDNVAHVHQAALDGASDLIAEAVKKGERDYNGRFDVEDEHGRKLFTLTFACPIHINLVAHD